MLKREWRAERNGKLGSCICSERPALGQNTLMMMMMMMVMNRYLSWGPEFASLSLHEVSCGRKGAWVDFSRTFSPFPCHKFHSTISHKHLTHFDSSDFIHPCNGASGVVGQHPCYAHTFKYRSFIASHPSTRSCVVHEFRIFIQFLSGTGCH